MLMQAPRMLNLKTVLGEELCLTAFEGEEALSQLFCFELEMISDNLAVEAKSLIGTRATFSIKRPDGSPRFLDGFISQFCAGDEDVREEGRHRVYSAEVVPWLWFLTCTRDCRIFQDMNVVEIIEETFLRHGFKDFDTSRVRDHHPNREYCVQYCETAYDFVARLTQEEGIYWYFAHEDGKHTLVLADGVDAYYSCPEREVDYPRDVGTLAIADHITSWRHRYEFRTGRWAQTDFNFKTPSHNLMTSEQTIIGVPQMAKYEAYDYPGLYENGDDGRPLTRIRLEEQEVNHDLVEAESLCKTFAPGGMFTVGQHRVASEQGKTYTIQSIRHRATEPLAYETGSASEFDYRNRFTCIPQNVAFRPARTTPRPIVEGPQTAIVVGPPGEEIYTDEHARVKVQFHWDRVGSHDHKSSCWMRVSQVHAGKGWGAVDLPRVGEEVIVEFLEGNPDRPIINGRVYNAQNTPPFRLDGANNATNKTRRGNMTKTYKGGGFNEMSMDDTPGKEQLRMNAQYNMDTNVGNNQTQVVGVDRMARVGNNEVSEVGVDQSATIGSDQTTSVGNNQSIKVGNDITIDAGNTICIKAGTSITLKCGASKLHMNQGGFISLTGTVIAITGAVNTSMSAPITNVTGGVLLTECGGIVQIVGGLTQVRGAKVDVLGEKTVIKGSPITLN